MMFKHRHCPPPYCIILVVKQSKVDAFAKFLYLRPPLLVLAVPDNSGMSRRIVCLQSTIHLILLVSSQPQIGYAIVQRVAVNVIYLHIWHCSVHVKPREAMSLISFTGNADLDAKIRFRNTPHTPCDLSKARPTAFHFPAEFSRVGTVVQHFFESLLVDHHASGFTRRLVTGSVAYA